MSREGDVLRAIRLGLITALLALLGVSCRTPDPDHFSLVRRRRPDGEEVLCRQPPASWFDSEESVAVSAAFPSLVQLMESSISTDEKVDYVLEYVHTLPTLDVLSFRFCLEYAKGTLSEHADIDWTGRVYPLVQERLGGDPLRTGRPGPYD